MFTVPPSCAHRPFNRVPCVWSTTEQLMMSTSAMSKSSFSTRTNAKKSEKSLVLCAHVLRIWSCAKHLSVFFTSLWYMMPTDSTRVRFGNACAARYTLSSRSVKLAVLSQS